VSSSQDDGPGSSAEGGEDAYQRAKTAVPFGEQLPELDFAMFVISLTHSAWMHLGDAPNPADGQLEVNLSMARQTIDLLALLQEKTRSNLTGDEERVLGQALYDLRVRYVEVAKSK
jgi:uncharacterized protein DUF1844